MAINGKIPFGKTVTNDVTEAARNESQSETEKDLGIATEQPLSDDGIEKVSENAQAGVQAIEATTMVWSKSHLIAAYIM